MEYESFTVNPISIYRYFKMLIIMHICTLLESDELKHLNISGYCPLNVDLNYNAACALDLPLDISRGVGLIGHCVQAGL